MELDRPFLKLPIIFVADALAMEVRALPTSAWVPHPTGFVGNEAVRLVSPQGQETENFLGEMGPTEHLLRSPHMMRVMEELGGVWGRSRLMGLGPHGEVPRHVDSHYYWRTHSRIHVPVITNPAVTFTCGEQTVHMAAGECWLFDSFRWHQVLNGGDAQRVHMVLDTVGGDSFWDLVDDARAGVTEPRVVSEGDGNADRLAFEKVNTPKIMSPWEIRTHLAFLAGHAKPHPRLDAVLHRLNRFADQWAVVWTRYGEDDGAWATYFAVLETLKRDLGQLGGGDILLDNGLKLFLALDHILLLNVLRPRDQTAAAPAIERRVAP